MTFSIVGRSADGACGVAVASKFLAVGAVVPAAEIGVGAIATQSYANVAYRPQGLAMLRTGVAAVESIPSTRYTASSAVSTKYIMLIIFCRGSRGKAMTIGFLI